LGERIARRYSAAFAELHHGAMPLATAVALLAASPGARRRSACWHHGSTPAWSAALAGGRPRAWWAPSSRTPARCCSSSPSSPSRLCACLSVGPLPQTWTWPRTPRGTLRAACSRRIRSGEEGVGCEICVVYSDRYTPRRCTVAHRPICKSVQVRLDQSYRKHTRMPAQLVVAVVRWDDSYFGRSARNR
jgi:hypothetical protein